MGSPGEAQERTARDGLAKMVKTIAARGVVRDVRFAGDELGRTRANP